MNGQQIVAGAAPSPIRPLGPSNNSAPPAPPSAPPAKPQLSPLRNRVPRAADALRMAGMAAACASFDARGTSVAVRRESLIGEELVRDNDTKGIVVGYDSNANKHALELKDQSIVEVDLTKEGGWKYLDGGGGGGGDDFAYKPPKHRVLDDDETEPERQPTLTARLPVVGGRIEIIPKGGLRPGETPFTGLVLAYVPATGKITVQWDKEEGDLEAGDGSGETTTFTLAKKVEDFRVQQPAPLVKAQRKVGDSAWTSPST